MMRRYGSYWTRFSQPDPYDGSYNLTDPQSFNRYAYVQNDPVNFVDPSGLDAASAARGLLGNASCRALFGNTDPFRLLNSIVSNNRLRATDEFLLSLGIHLTSATAF